MNDPAIRKLVFNKYLYQYHNDPSTLIIEELGLEHGKCRADIAVINGYLDGFEIKSREDNLRRLDQQIACYNAVFDHTTIILEDIHLDNVIKKIPDWWGIIVIVNHNNDYRFNIIKPSLENPNVDINTIVKLLWRKEVQEILFLDGIKGSTLRQNRSILYNVLVEIKRPEELRFLVRKYLKHRQYWRHFSKQLQDDDLFQPSAM